jgi:hypothetical protein
MEHLIIWIGIAVLVAVGSFAIFIVLAGGKVSNNDRSNTFNRNSSHCRHGMNGDKCPACRN